VTDQAFDDEASGRKSNRGQLWQVPVFLVGLLAVAGVWTARPYWHAPGTPQVEHDLAEVRKALDPKSPNTAVALALGEELLDRLDQLPGREGEVHYLLGSAYLRRVTEVSREQSGWALRLALSHLEEAASVGVPPAERSRLSYRLAKVWFLSGSDPKRIIDTLVPALETGTDDLHEAYGMLTQAYLRLPSPNLQGALEANAKQISLPTDDESLLDPARLLRGELLLRSKKPEEARKVLARIQRTAPNGIYARARQLRAQSCQDSGLWQEAAELWVEILNDTKAPPPDAGRISYYVGFCYRRMDRADDASRTWERISQQEGESGQAAAFSVADLRLKSNNPGAALEYLERALRNVHSPADYRNSLFNVIEAERLLNNACRSLMKSKEFEAANRSAQLDAKLAPAASLELQGNVEETWAKECLERASAARGTDADRLNDEAAAHFRDAGAHYRALAESIRGKPEVAKWLWLTADCLRQGRDYPQTTTVLQQYISVEKLPEKLGEAWYTLGEVNRKVENVIEARAAYHKCIEYPGPSAFRARFRLAQSDLAEARAQKNQAKLEDAEKALEHNLDLMRFAPDEEAYEQTLLVLAGLLVERGQYRTAAVRLQETLDRYPGTSHQVNSRLQLADCYKRLASQQDQILKSNPFLTEDAQVHYREQRRLWLQQASANYEKVADDLTTRGPLGKLPEPEEGILRQALFAAADCQIEQANYADAIRFFERIAARYPRHLEGLKGLKEITRCYWLQKDKEKARVTLQRFREALKEAPDLPAAKELEKWLQWAWEQ
jgi:tetratricopeptide (TPR) repeat protein